MIFAISRNSETPAAPRRTSCNSLFDIGELRCIVIGSRWSHKCQDAANLIRCKLRAFREITGFILAAFAEQGFHAAFAQPIKLVERAQNDAAARAIFGNARGLPESHRAICGC